MRFLILLILFSTIAKSESIEMDKCYKNPMFGYFFRQEKYSTQNEKEDEILRNLTLGHFSSFLKHFKIRKKNKRLNDQYVRQIKKDCPTYKAVYNDKRNYTSDSTENILNQCRQELVDFKAEKLGCKINKALRKSPVKVKKYTKMFKKVIQKYEKKHGQKVFLSRPHTWSNNERRPLLPRFDSKLLTSLALGVTNRFMMTPHDKVLRNWLERQSYLSVTPEKLFKKALDLSKGDVYKALLSIENVLSEFWKDKKRHQLRQTASLSSITNHCPGLGREDIFGSWYHFFGVMLLGCVEGEIKANLVGRVENLGGRVLDIKHTKENKLIHLLIGSDPQEEIINRRGGIIGHKVCKNRLKNY
tara:strand:+ start:631 stop:1704 length:1074 start_codon:yes stop_codon:yes gene_type:complete